MATILSKNTKKWKSFEKPLLLITSTYPGSGKSTLAVKLAIENGAKLIQLDELYPFLRFDKWYPLQIHGYNMESLEKYITEDILHRGISYLERNSNITKCFDMCRATTFLRVIQFFKREIPDLYEKMKEARFGTPFYVIGKDYHNSEEAKILWDQWTRWILHRCRNVKRPIIVEGGQLNSVLDSYENFKLILTTPLVIIETSEWNSLWQMATRKLDEENAWNPSKVKTFFRKLRFVLRNRNKPYMRKMIEENRNHMIGIKSIGRKFWKDYVAEPKDWRPNINAIL